MTIRRRAAAIGAVVVGLAALAACDKPTPLAYITSGTHSVHTDAKGKCYNDGDQISRQQVLDCIKQKADTTITVHSGERIRFGADPKIADKGWYLVLNQQPVTDPTKDTYRSFQADQFFQVDQNTGQRSKKVSISIVEGSLLKNRHYGVWNFTVKLSE
jgi:hypothetical protein